MTDNPHDINADSATYKRRGFSYIWIVPILALIVVGWTAWTSWHGKGPTVTITFQKVEGIDIHRTVIRHKGVPLGMVTKIQPNKDFKTVTVTAQMNDEAAPYLKKNTLFWVVRPRVSVGGISDLNTLISGVYIELDPGDGDGNRNFTGLEDPPAVDQQDIGRNFILRTGALGSLDRGSPVYFRGFKVGQVTTFELDADNEVLVHIFVREPYGKLVLQQSRFWNVSGIGVTAGAEGFRISAQSLQAVVQGGVAFDVPTGISGGGDIADGTQFALYANKDEANNSVYTKKLDYLVRFAGSVQGLDAGAAVNLLGNRVGQVVQTAIEVDAKTGTAISEITMEIQPERIRFANAADGGDVVEHARAAFDEMAKHKLRAELASGNLLTGQKSINLQYVPEAPTDQIKPGDPLPLFPSIQPNDIDAVMHQAHKVLQDADDFILTTGPEVKPLLESFKTTADQINTDDGNGGLSGTLDEMKQAARAVRNLADYLDAHPESLLRGKKGDK